MTRFEEMSRTELLEELRALEARPRALHAAPEEALRDAAHLLQELRVHQVELEMQNRELREAQASLEESRARYADLYDFAPTGYCTFDDKGCIQEINLTGAALLGMDRARLVGRPFVASLPSSEIQPFLSHLRRSAGGTDRVTCELSLSPPGRDPVVLLLASTPVVDAAGRKVCRTVFTDISERKRSENGLRLLARSGDALVSSLDIAETLGAVARLAIPDLGDCCVVEVLGDGGALSIAAVAHVDPRLEEVVREARRRHPARPATTTTRGVAQALRSGAPVVWPEPADPSRVPVELGPEHSRFLRELGARSYLCVPLRARGRTLGVVTFVATGRRFDALDLALARDLVQAASLAMDNARLYQEAQQAVRVREEVLAVVSHDLKNPLQQIGLQAELLLRKRADGEERRAVGRKQAEGIQRSAERMKRLISDLLDFSSIEAGRLSMRREAHELGAVVRAAVEALRPSVAERELHLGVTLPDGDVPVFCDRDRLIEVLENLLGNAIKFTPRQGSIEVRVARLGREARLSVADTGPGIPSESLERIFDRFWQSPGTAKKGSGLGLFIAKAIVEAEGGRIWAESAPGAGTTFFVTLPLRADDTRAAGEPG